MQYFTKKEILENLKSNIERSSARETLADVIAGCYRQYNYKHPYIADNAEAVDAISRFARLTGVSLFTVRSYIKGHAHYYGGRWNEQRLATELEIALIVNTQNLILGTTKSKKIALKRIDDELSRTSNDEIGVLALS